MFASLQRCHPVVGVDVRLVERVRADQGALGARQNSDPAPKLVVPVRRGEEEPETPHQSQHSHKNVQQLHPVLAEMEVEPVLPSPHGHGDAGHLSATT